MDVTHLDGLPLFAALSQKQRQLVAQHAEEVDVAAGKELVHEGGFAWEFFVIRDGSAEVRHGAQVIRTLGPGDFFGEIGVLSAPVGRRTASVITTSPMTAVVMSSHDLRAIAKEMPELADQLGAAIAQRKE
jgi:cAMP-dependent protein kinase regulator/CRP/FNR family cyclic AMP-dependent transcriptional regulator/cGMP-dependent protein kinase 2